MPKYSPFASESFRVSSPYGSRPDLGGWHAGIDLVDLSPDRIVTAVMGGKVIRSRIAPYSGTDRTWEWGNYVAVQQDDGRIAYYCHLEERSVDMGEIVRAGDRIGIMGSTGYSTGPHLHLEIRDPMTAINPAEYLGIPNTVGICSMPTPPQLDCAAEVCRICGLEQQTRDYLDAYKYADDLWRKIYNKIKGGQT